MLHKSLQKATYADHDCDIVYDWSRPAAGGGGDYVIRRRVTSPGRNSTFDHIGQLDQQARIVKAHMPEL